jgi:hypothetical protein
MQRPRVLQAFTGAEYEKAHRLLGAKLAFMMGRKFEEGDWGEVYCSAKGILYAGWSNLNIDVVFNGVGVEHKMLRPAGDKLVSNVFGTRLMHPSATRSIRIEDGEANEVMRSVLLQYAAFIEHRREFVRERCPEGEPDLRTGWVLWQSNLREFLYFEEETLVPYPDDFIAEWHENEGRGARKQSRSLWIYERDTGQKKYSVTTSAGAKIQPYFDVPPASDPNVYFFRVQGEEFKPGLIRVWIPVATARDLERLAGGLSTEKLDAIITQSGVKVAESGPTYRTNPEEASDITLTTASYQSLRDLFPDAVSDAHLIQLLVAQLSL